MEEFEVVIDPTSYADIFLAADICPVEISGLAKVIKESGRYLIFGEPFIPKQKCMDNGTETDFDMIAYGKWCDEMIRSGREVELKQFRLWWHSHARSDVYFSITDENTITTIGGFYSEWWMHLVVNKRNQASLRLDIYKPERQPPKYIETKIKFSSPTNSAMMKNLMSERKERMRKIIEEKVEIVSAWRWDDD